MFQELDLIIQVFDFHFRVNYPFNNTLYVVFALYLHFFILPL